MIFKKQRNARWLAHEAHYDQVDKLGIPYVNHPKTVARIVRELYPHCPAVVVDVAWCHDVLEDSELIDEEILRMHLSKDVVDAVVAITHLPNEPLETYWDRVKSNEWALMVKHADILHNSHPDRLRELDVETRIRLTNKYGRALKYLGLKFYLVQLGDEYNGKGSA